MEKQFNKRFIMRVANFYKHPTLCNFMLQAFDELNIKSFFTLFGSSAYQMNSYTEKIKNHNKKLDIEYDEIKLLEQFNFWEQVVSDEIICLLNLKFDQIFIPFLPEHQVHKLCTRYTGIINILAFGRNYPSNYYEIEIFKTLENYSNVKLLYAYECIYNTQLYSEKLKSISCYMPIGISKEFINKYLNTYCPEKNQVIFVCSWLENSHYNYNFIDKFSDLKYIILGYNQKNESANIKGYLEDDDFYEEIRKSKVMYYHSQEPCHLHYHPIEAMIIGVPVIFLANSILDQLGLKEGKCNTIEEAKIKIKNIIDNNDNTNDIINGQKKFIDKFYINYDFKNNIKKILNMPASMKEKLEVLTKISLQSKSTL